MACRLLARGTLAATIALGACSGGSGTPVAPIRGIGPAATPTSTPALSPSPRPSSIATATPSATAPSTASPVPTATPTGIVTNTCASPLPAGPSIFYSASIDSPAVTVYAGDFTGSSTANFDIAANGNYANGQNDGLEVPYSVALGPNGNVYVLETAGAQATSASVAEYLPNFDCMGPVAMLNALPVGGSIPGAVAVDAAGYVYVASQFPRQLALYAPLAGGSQASSALATIAIPSVDSGSSNLADNDPIGMKLDASGRIYIANGADKSILVYPARSGSTLAATPSATIAGTATTLQTTSGVATDASGKIYVVDDDYPYGVKIFAPNPSGTTNAAPIAAIAGAQTQMYYAPISVAVDHLGVIYVGDYNTPSTSAIIEFPANPSGTVDEAPQGILSGVGNPAGLVAK